MIITIQSTGQNLDIPIDTKLSIEMASPIFSSANSMSLPISLPLTKTNRKALNFPDRLDLYDSSEDAVRAIPDVAVVVTHGSWQYQATLVVSGCSVKTAEATLYFNEAGIWSQIGDSTLPQIMADLHYGDIPGEGADIDTYRANLFNALNHDFQSYTFVKDLREAESLQMQAIYYEDWKNMYENRAEWLKTREFVIAPVYTNDGWLNNMKPRTNGCHKLVGTAPYLYITAFLRLDFILHRIFQYFGETLSIDFSTFSTTEQNSFWEEQWHSVCVINNTMDALYPGYLPYSALVPDISCKDFLLAVQAQFGTSFIRQSNGTYMMKFIGNVLSSPKGKAIGDYHDLQVSFNTSAEYSPADGMNQQGEPNVKKYFMSALEATHDMESPPRARDSYPWLHAVSLDGVCQRTTTSTIDGEDTTKNTQCPLVFANFETSYMEYTVTDDIHPDVVIETFYPCLRNTYWEYYGGSTDPFDENNIQKLVYKEMHADSLYHCMNHPYNTIAENCDLVTIQTTMSNIELLIFDFTRSLVIHGRLCWPTKLRFELKNTDRQQVTMDLLAPRKRISSSH